MSRPDTVSPQPPAQQHRCGFCAVVGRPNVGKSTLLNRIVGDKVAIVSPRPQTTRNRLTGIKTTGDTQLILVDTPGIHKARGLMTGRMVATALRSLRETDVVLLVVDASRGLRPEDEDVAALSAQAGTEIVVALNKMDRVKKEALLPLIQRVADLLPGREIVPVSALTGENVADLLDTIVSRLPAGPALFPADEVTEQTERFLAQEMIREKLLLHTREEVPYNTAVLVESFEEKPDRGLIVIRATIYVERPSQKPIVIGEGGARIKEIGRSARLEMEAFFGTKVYVELFVKVRRGWSKDARVLAELGI